MSARSVTRPVRSRRLTHGPEEGAARIAAAAQAVRRHLSTQRTGTHRRVLGVLEAVRRKSDPEWYYIVIAQSEDDNWEILHVWAESGRWRVQYRCNGLSWAGAVVQAMAEATRLER